MPGLHGRLQFHQRLLPLRAYNFQAGTTLWTSPGLGTPVALAHGDLNGDGFPDLAALTGDGHVSVWDVHNQASIWTSTTLTGARSLAVADLDGAGRPQIVALASDRVVKFVWSAQAGLFLEAASSAVAGQDLLVADTEGDGRQEVYVLAGDSYGTTTAKVFRFDAGLQPLGSFSAPGAVSLHVEGGASLHRNLLLSVLHVADLYSNQAPSYLVAVDPVTGSEVWRSPDLPGKVPMGSLSYVTLQGEAQPRLAFGLSKGMVVSR